MPTYKLVTLKDPVTGEYLIPRTPLSLGYEVQPDGSLTPPIEMDAATLGGKPASEYMLKSEYTPVDLSDYLQASVADTKYAVKSHTHTTAQVTGLDGALAGKAAVSHTHTPSSIGAAAASHTHSIAQVTGLQSELDNLKTSGSEGKSLIASAITAKGVSTAADATFQQMANNIRAIPSGGHFVDKAPDSQRSDAYNKYYTFNIDAGYTLGTDVFICPLDFSYGVSHTNGGSANSNYSAMFNTTQTSNQITVKCLIGTFPLSSGTVTYMADLRTARIIYLH